MNFRRKREEDFSVDITPLVDVVFILLLFFMVSTTFKQDFKVSLELPKAASDQKIEERVTEIVIDAQGKFFVNQKQLVNSQPATVKQALQQAQKDVTKPIVISADGNTPHQAVITAMDAARQAGFSRITFATQQQKGE